MKLPSPRPRARVIIAPHSGYIYGGRVAAHAFATLDLTNIRRIVVLAPSHGFPLRGLAVTQASLLATPLGNLPVDVTTLQSITAAATPHVPVIRLPPRADLGEHAVELQLPFIAVAIAASTTTTHTNALTKDANATPIAVAPLLVGSLSPSQEAAVGRALRGIFCDSTTAIIVSSDFCHYGERFGYAPFPIPTAPAIPQTKSGANTNSRWSFHNHVASLSTTTPHTSPSSTTATSSPTPIADAIEGLDLACVATIAAGDPSALSEYFQATENTVCGRHAIAVTVAAMAERRCAAHLVAYEQSERIRRHGESSVSYAAIALCDTAT